MPLIIIQNISAVHTVNSHYNSVITLSKLIFDIGMSKTI